MLTHAMPAIISLLPVLAPCEMCFGAGSNSPVVTAIGLSMLGLLLVTGFVLVSVTKFFVSMERRAKALEQAGFHDRVSTNGDLP